MAKFKRAPGAQYRGANQISCVGTLDSSPSHQAQRNSNHRQAVEYLPKMQGFNMGRYYPPSDEPPAFNQSSHPLGNRARKVGQGILTVRFEMPFPIWCLGCPKPAIIAEGVRFNAEKKMIGKYHSSPIWSFRMKHNACGGLIEIQTDPKHIQYVVTEGAKKRDYGDEKETAFDHALDQGGIISPEERERRRNDAFAALEGRNQDKAQAKITTDRIEELKEYRDKSWKDPGLANQRLRSTFRKERKQLARKAHNEEGIRGKYSLGIDIMPEEEGDSVLASSVDFGESDDERIRKRMTAPLFPSNIKIPTVGEFAFVETRRKKEKERSIKLLQLEVQNNTRIARDPFLNPTPRVPFKGIPGIKRKAKPGAGSKAVVPDPPAPVPTPAPTNTTAAAPVEKPQPTSNLLVGYYSDSD